MVTCASLAAFPVPLEAQADPSGTDRGPGGIVAIVNQDVITQGNLDREVAYEMRRAVLILGVDPTTLERQRPRFERHVLDKLIQDRLMLQDAKQNDITTNDLEIDLEIKNEIETKWRPAGIDVKDAEELYPVVEQMFGIDRQEYREKIREKILIGRLLMTKYYRPPFITPGELREFYHKNSKLFDTPSELTFRMIVIDKTSDALGSMEYLDRELDRGRSFEELCKEIYKDQGENAYTWKKSMKDLEGWLQPLPKVLTEMKEGEIQRRIPVFNGWRYVEMLKIKREERKSFEEVQGEIEAFIHRQHRERVENRLVARLKKNAYFRIFLPDLPDTPGQKSAEKPNGEKPSGQVRDVSPQPAVPKNGAGQPGPK